MVSISAASEDILDESVVANENEEFEAPIMTFNQRR